MAKNSNKPSIRFKGFTDAWEQCKLGDIGKTYGGLSGKSKEDFGHGDARFVTYMNCLEKKKRKNRWLKAEYMVFM